MSQQIVEEEKRTAALVAPAAILGVGEFGRRVLVALERARQTRPVLPHLPGLLVMPDGWKVAWDETASGAWDDPGGWWRAHQEEGRARLQELILRALYGGGAGGQDSRAPAVQDEGLDIYLVGHFNEPATRALWPHLLQAARKAHIPFADHVFTLIFALDSLAFRDLAPAEADDFRQGLDDLAGELLRAADGNEPPGRVGYAYLIDSLDMHARPLRPLSWQGDGGGATPSADERLNLQAHMTAEFIALAVAGLRRTPDYKSVSLSRLAQEMRGEKAQPLVATFAAGS